MSNELFDELPKEARQPIEFEVLSLSSSPTMLGSILLLVAAFAFHRTWEELFFIGATPYFPTLGFSNYQIFLLAKGLALLACVAAARIIDAGWNHRAPANIAGVLLLLSSGLMLTTLMDGGDSAIAVLAAGILGGVASGLFTVLWFEQCRSLSAAVVVLSFLVACMVAPLIIVMGEHFGVIWVAAVGPLLAVAAVACLTQGLSDLSRNTAGSGDEKPLVCEVKNDTFWKTSLLLGIFTFAFAMGKPVLGNDMFAAGSHTALGALLVSAFVCVGIATNNRRFDIVTLFRIVLPATAVFSLLLLTGAPFMMPLADNCLSASFKIAEVLAVSTLANLCFRRRSSPARLIGIAFGLKTLFCFFGGAVWDVVAFVSGVSASHEWVTVGFGAVIAVAVLVAMIMLPSRASFAITKATLRPDEDIRRSESTEMLEYRCHDLAKRVGLTPREEEILLLFAEGLSVREVQERLYISKETVKTHRRNIYCKCGVADRGELLALLDVSSAGGGQADILC